MTPQQRYRADIAAGRLTADPAQLSVVNSMQLLYDELAAVNTAGRWKFLGRLLPWRAPRPVTGLYLWGGVGGGKTWLADMLYGCLPFAARQRVHFHRYMQWVHAELRQLKEMEAPLQRVAARLAGEVRVLCLDEFHVGDITDAMLLSGLLDALFARGVTLVATSNEHPDDLYRDGLQRQRFLPAIALIKRHTRVIHLDAGADYRLRYLDQAELYHCPAGPAAREKLEEHFHHIARANGVADADLEIEGRRIRAARLASGVAWFDFDEICGAGRGAADYIEIARQFQTVFVENVPRMDDADNDRARRFITMVDEYYDRNVKLVMTAAAAPARLYAGRRLAREFARAASRLIEMQSHDYLARPHLP